MDNNEGLFKAINEEKFNEQVKENESQVFRVGEILEIRGSRFQVKKIYPRKLLLKLLPKN